VGYLPLELSRADEIDHDVIASLIGTAAEWLARTKNTDQWMQPWRSEELRAYYERQGFTSCGTSSDPDYPSGALFQKPTRHLRPPQPPLFRET
jgi:hypothetical protein